MFDIRERVEEHNSPKFGAENLDLDSDRDRVGVYPGSGIESRIGLKGGSCDETKIQKSANIPSAKVQKLLFDAAIELRTNSGLGFGMLVSMQWFQKWTQWTQYPNSQLPGPVDNSDLLQVGYDYSQDSSIEGHGDGSDVEVQRGLVRGINYKVVNDYEWDLLVRWCVFIFA